MLIPESKIEEVLERVDILSVVSRYVELKKAGRSYKGKCPFHQEKTASFHVTPEMRRFKCFGCQVGGDAIAFLQRYLGKPFLEVVKDLAREVGVDIAAGEDPGAAERRQLKEATDFAARRFRESLWDPVGGKKARDYLLSRGIGEETARRFDLGFAPLSWSDLSDAMLKEGLLEWGAAAGLVQRRSKGEGYFDVFRGRLIVPIHSPEGRPIAFGGRLLEGDDGPKYLNSKESKLYNKSETLYGADRAKEAIHRRKSAVLVEGYFDCIALHQVGVDHAVALCSTALTPGHLALLKRLEAREVVLLLDGDEAGRKAVERLAGPLLSQGTNAKVALLPEGEDPDTYARKAGEQGVRALLASALPLSEHLFRTLVPGGKDAPFEEKMQALERLKPAAAQLPVGLFRSAFFGALSRYLGLPAAELETALKGRSPAAAPKPVPKPGAPDRPMAERGPDPLEATFAAALLRRPALIEADVLRAIDDLRHIGVRGVVGHLAQGRWPEDALFEAPGPVKRAIEQAARQLPSEASELDRAFFTLCQKLRLRRIDEDLRRLTHLATSMGHGEEQSEETQRLQEERVHLLALKKKVLEATAPGTKAPSQPV